MCNRIAPMFRTLALTVLGPSRNQKHQQYDKNSA
jgi:hypothetical protein